MRTFNATVRGPDQLSLPSISSTHHNPLNDAPSYNLVTNTVLSDLKIDNLTASDGSDIHALLPKSEGLYDGTLCKVTTSEHTIDITAGTRPMRLQKYQAGQRTRTVETEYIARRLSRGVIEPDNTRYAAPVV